MILIVSIVVAEKFIRSRGEGVAISCSCASIRPK